MPEYYSQLPRVCDLAIVGAGPAGMAAATTATRFGLSVVILDEGRAPGGQIYRDIEHSTSRLKSLLGPDYNAGVTMATELRSSDAIYLPQSTVWNISTDRLIDYSCEQRSFQLQAKYILAATGSVERACPIPGWTKPGVTTVGALQILLKSAGIVEEDSIVAGSGPLLWLVASQMIAAGVPPVAVVETTPPGRWRAALPHLAGALRGHRYLRKGLTMIRKVRAANVPIYTAATELKIMGEHETTGLQFVSKGNTHTVCARYVALHQGVVPNPQVTRLLRCDHRWDTMQQCFRPVITARGRTSFKNLYVAGDGAGIMGAVAAALQGQLAALDIAADMGRIKPDRALRLQQRLAKEGAVRPFLEALYAPATEFLLPADQVTVCRCEEITAGAIRSAVDLGAPGPNQVKSCLRAGMGLCQGRVCGLVVSAIIAERRKLEMDEIDYFRIRPPLKPLRLQELAGFQAMEEFEQ